MSGAGLKFFIELQVSELRSSLRKNDCESDERTDYLNIAERRWMSRIKSRSHEISLFLSVPLLVLSVLCN